MFELYVNPTANLDADFHQACLKGDTHAAERLLTEGADINCVRGDMPAILLAANGEHWETLRMLIEKGAEVNCKNRHGWSPLHIAAQKGHEESIKKLQEANAFVNRRDAAGDTALYIAAQANQIGAVQLLLELGADPMIANKKGDTPMHWAARNDNADMVSLLASKGGSAAAENLDGETPVTLATSESLKAAMEKVEITRSVNEAMGEPEGGDKAAQENASSSPEGAAPAPSEGRKRIRKV